MTRAVRAEMGQFREETRGGFSEIRGQLVDVNVALVQIVARLPGPPPH